MKVLILAGQFYPDLAGSAVATHNVARYLSARGHEVTVVADSANRPALEQRDLPYRVEYARLYKAFMTGDAGFKKATEDIYAIVQKSGFDIIHVQSYLPMLLFSLIRDLIKLPVVFTFWSTPYKLERSIGFYDVSALDMQLSTSIIKLEKYDRLVLGSKSSYNSAIGQGADPRITSIAYYGIDLAEFDEFLATSDAINISDYLDGLRPDDKLIMLPGRVTERKGTREAVEAFAIVNESVPSKLLLTGMLEPYDKKFAVQISQLAAEIGVADRVLIPKKIIHRDKVAAFYKRADVVLVPSYSENLGFTAIEAARASRPLVATDVEGLNEFLEDGVNCLLVPPKDSKQLAGAILALLTDKNLVDRITACAPESVAGFDMRHFVDESERIYLELMEARSIV
jgi:glycosyltransferase involved in cell wall biosynthesis